MQWKTICLVSMAGCLLLSQSGCAASSKNIKTEENTQTQEATVQTQETAAQTQEDTWMQVDFLDVGKADAIVVQTQSHTIAIDCGEKDDGMDMVQFLKDNNVETLDYLIITHYDQDHVGGAAKVIRKIGANTVIAPDYTEKSSEYEKYIAALSDTGISPILLTADDCFILDDVTFTVYASYPYTYTENTDNNSSLVVRAEHGENVFLFAGDAMEERLEELMDIGECTLLKVPYHGRDISNLLDFLEKVQPKFSIISSTESVISENTVSLLEDAGASVYATSWNGHITAISDGNTIQIETER